jgi:transcriptional regulator with XRE-family HTH domain
MDAAEMLRAARRRSGLSQSEVAQRAGVHHTMVSAYERGRRTPGMTTFKRLLAAAGSELAIELVSAGSSVDDRITHALAQSAEARIDRFAEALHQVIGLLAQTRLAVNGLAAAALHGVPVDVERIDLLLANEPNAPEAAATALLRNGVMVWAEQLLRFTHMPAAPHLVMRAADPSLWWFPLWEVQVEITLCPPERLARAQLVPLRDTQVPVIGLWDLQVNDPAAADLIERTRARMAS